MERRYMRTKQAGEYLSIPEASLEKWRLRGDGPPFIRAGHRVLYDVHALDEWMAARARQSTSEPEPARGGAA